MIERLIVDWDKAAKRFSQKKQAKLLAPNIPQDTTLKDALNKANREDAARAKVLAKDLNDFMRTNGESAKRVLKSSGKRIRLVEVTDSETGGHLGYYYLDGEGFWHQKGKLKATTVEEVARRAVSFSRIDFRKYTLSAFITDEINRIIEVGLKEK